GVAGVSQNGAILESGLIPGQPWKLDLLLQTNMKYRDLRGFMAWLEAGGDLARIREPVSTRLEMTAVSDFVLRQHGPALLFERSPGYKIPVLTNLFGTPARVAKAMGVTEVGELREI